MAANTTANCLDPTIAFSTPESLFTCFQVFASQDSSPPYNPDYGYNGLYVEPSSTFGIVIGECIKQYCLKPDSALNGCGASDNQTLWFINSDHFSASGCAFVNTALNQDFSGPGMMVAFLMQALIVFYIWLAIRSLLVMPICVRWFYHHELWHESIPLISMEEKLSRHVSIVKSVLIDFQEAQCFFVICIQAAVLVAFAGDSTILSSSSLSQLQANYAEATWISVAATTSVTFGLWILHGSSLDSTYIHLWSMVSVILSGITLFFKSYEEPNLSGIHWDGDFQHLDKCGHHPPPLIYCSYYNSMLVRGDVDYTNVVNYITRRAVAPCFAICGILGLQRIASYPPKKYSLFAMFALLSRAIQSTIPPRAFPILITVWNLLAESYLVGAAVSVVVGDVEKLLYNLQYETTGSNDWTFGQIIAVTIWAPIMIKYIYWAVFGTESYSATRLSEPFHIVQTKSKIDAPSEADEEQHIYSHVPSNGEVDLQTIQPGTRTISHDTGSRHSR